MINLEQRTAGEINKALAGRMAKLRKRRKLSQQALAMKSGVSFGSVKRFEQTGEISLQSLTKIAIALEVEGELESLFSQVLYESLEEILNEQGR
ncbi:helix-turn-helix transcriptional regulator [Anaerovibrio sp.]|uniref:helix-turn-helix domain-containing protein n=1 Tax=Anaerovibrio sp. TaxID=1872532 RepID=UPI001B57D3DD|nr:helix-turn-helix transcriptional regulator [Anaerovibrio sp.]MBP3232090.1 helix-turn-helix transcriptional regulator [Anaerovibrio sp.]MBR2143479.1 helix-turn-helix transcriptional regulator [Anaerovibrio sp.]